MIVDTLDKLPRFAPDEPLVIDEETISYRDYDHGHAFDGKTRVGGYAICAHDAGVYRSWYIPVRSRSGVENECLPLEHVQRYLQTEIWNGKRTWINHNIKFDGRFATHDGFDPDKIGEMHDTMVLARLVECERFSYSLDALAWSYLKKRKTTDTVKAYLESLKVKKNEKAKKDYGLVPVSVLGPYAEQDVLLTFELYHKLMGELERLGTEDFDPKMVWKVEVALTKWLLRSEIRGIPVNKKAINQTWMHCLRECMEITQALSENIGREFDPSSDKEVTQLLVGELGVVPKAFTEKTHKPQWNGMALRTLEGDERVKKIGEALAKYRNTAAFAASFCEGWLDRIGIDGRIHPSFMIAGTATGRLSCRDPNLQNVTPRAENFVEIPDDRILIAWDYSQIEYRIFGHYTDDPLIVKEYATNPDADFHQFLADILGVDRQFAKQLNFSFLYGMGKEKLLRNLSGILTLKADESDEMREKMRLMAYGAGTSISQRAKQLNASEESKLMAEKIYENYHSKFPSIRAFQRKVSIAIKHRGWIRNFFGRVYRLDERGIHKGVNYIVQGSAADLFKQRMVALFTELWGQFDFEMLTNVHDSAIFSVRRDHGWDFFREGTRILEHNVGLKLPIKAEGKLSTKTWGTVVKVKKCTKEAYDEAVANSTTAMTRLAGLARHEWDDPDAKTKGRYEFGPAKPKELRKEVTPIEATAIKNEFARGRVTRAELAKKFNCTVEAVEVALK